jgi:hypothetical protein
MPHCEILERADQREIENREPAACVNLWRMDSRQEITGAASERWKWGSPAWPLVATNEPGEERMEICGSSDNDEGFNGRHPSNCEGSNIGRRFCRM